MQNSKTLHSGFFNSTRPRDPVWKGSTRGEVKFSPITRQQRRDVWKRARDFEARTRARRGGGHGAGAARVVNGDISRVGLNVLHALLFDFLNMRSGRLDPMYETLAWRAGVSVSSVYRSLRRLAKVGLLTWTRRCSGSMQDGRWTMEQDSNAYAIDGAWHEVKVPPGSLELGQHPPLPGGLEAARSCQGPQSIQAALESDPGDPLAASAARLGRRLFR